MITYEDEQKEKFKRFDQFLDNCRNLIKEIEQTRKKEEKVKQSISKNTLQQSQQFQNHSLYNSLKDSDFHKLPLTLLFETQEYDDNLSYQKLMDLFIEENQTVIDLPFNNNNVNEYLILQLYTAFSLKARKVYLDLSEDSKENEKLRMSLITLNNIQYDKKAPLNNSILNFINHNILRVDDIYQTAEARENNFKREKQNEKVVQMEKDIPIFEGIEHSKWQLEIQTKFDIENDDEKVIQGDSVSLKPKFKNLEEINQKIQIQKIDNIQKIIQMDDKELEGLSGEELEDALRKTYEEGDEKVFNFEDSDNSSLAEIRDRYSDDSKSIGSSTSRQLGLNLEKRNSKDDYFITKDYSKMKKNFGFDSINEPVD